MWTLFGVLEFHLIPVQAGKHKCRFKSDPAQFSPAFA